MTGSIAAILSAGGTTPIGAGGAVVPTSLAWNDIYGEDSGSTQSLVISGTTAPISVGASRTGGGILGYALNGAYLSYTETFTVNPNDSLQWIISIVGTVEKAGVVTVTNVTTSTVLDTFNYNVYSSRGVRP